MFQDPHQVDEGRRWRFLRPGESLGHNFPKVHHAHNMSMFGLSTYHFHYHLCNPCHAHLTPQTHQTATFFLLPQAPVQFRQGGSPPPPCAPGNPLPGKPLFDLHSKARLPPVPHGMDCHTVSLSILYFVLTPPFSMQHLMCPGAQVFPLGF